MLHSLPFSGTNFTKSKISKMNFLKFLKSNISNILFFSFAAILFFSNDARTMVIKGLLLTGLYNVDAPDQEKANHAPAPEIVFRSQKGEIINIGRDKGTVYFINFWATWCPPCRAEMPSINALSSKITNKDKVKFVMVDVDNKMDASVRFMEKRKMNLQVYNAVSAIPDTLFNGTLPTTVIINSEGKIVFRHSGMADYDSPEMINFINTLIP